MNICCRAMSTWFKSSWPGVICTRQYLMRISTKNSCDGIQGQQTHHGIGKHRFSPMPRSSDKPYTLRLDLDNAYWMPLVMSMQHLVKVIAVYRGRSIALDVARGLFYLHSNNVVHLDIKARTLPHEHLLASLFDDTTSHNTARLALCDEFSCQPALTVVAMPLSPAPPECTMPASYIAVNEYAVDDGRAQTFFWPRIGPPRSQMWAWLGRCSPNHISRLCQGAHITGRRQSASWGTLHPMQQTSGALAS